jgi:hypothetical protein
LREKRKEQAGAIAQLGERQLCKLDVVGSIPTGSKNEREVGERRKLGEMGMKVCAVGY